MTAPKTMAEINKRLSAIGEELAKGRLRPVATAKELEAEEARLKIELAAVMEHEAQENMIRARIDAARRESQEAEREKRIATAVKAELGKSA